MASGWLLNKLEKNRRLLGHTREDLVRLTGIDYQRLLKLERGFVTATQAEVGAICEKLDLAPNDIGVFV